MIVPVVVGAMFTVWALLELLPTVTVPVAAPLAMLTAAVVAGAMVTAEAVPPIVMVPDVCVPILMVCDAVGAVDLPIVIVPVDVPLPRSSWANEPDETAGAMVTMDAEFPIVMVPCAFFPTLTTFPPTVIVPVLVAPRLISCDEGVAVLAPRLSFPVAPAPVGELEAILTCVVAPPKLHNPLAPTPKYPDCDTHAAGFKVGLHPMLTSSTVGA